MHSGSRTATAAVGGLSAPVIERFLRTGDETWDGAGSGRFTLAQFTQDEVYTRAAKGALRTLFRLLSNLLPAETLSLSQWLRKQFGVALSQW